MAVIDVNPGLRTEVMVNRKPLAEHDNDDVDAAPAEVNKNIEACTGVEFVIKTNLKNPFPRDDDVEVTCSMDGHRAACWAVDPDEPTSYAPKKMKGMTLSQASQRVHQNFKFAELNVVEDDDGAISLQDLLRELECKGAIEVSYRWIMDFRARKQSSKSQAPPAQYDDDERDRTLPRRGLPIAGAGPE